MSFRESFSPALSCFLTFFIGPITWVKSIMTEIKSKILALPCLPPIPQKPEENHSSSDYYSKEIDVCDKIDIER